VVEWIIDEVLEIPPASSCVATGVADLFFVVPVILTLAEKEELQWHCDGETYIKELVVERIFPYI
jgi:hypothetical protein